MMSQFANAEYLTMTAAAALVGPRRRGRPTWHRTIRRWIEEGVGGIRLKSMYRGGILMTRADWIDEFFAAIKQKRDSRRRPNAIELSSYSEEQRRRDRVRDELKAMGAL